MRNFYLLLTIIIFAFTVSEGVEVTISEEAYNYFVEGEKLANSGDYKGAIEKFNDVLSLEPNLIQANEWLAFCYIHLGDNENAKKQYEKIVKVNPTIDNLVNLGLTYYNLGYYNDAVQTLKKAVNKDPSHFNALNNLGLALIMNRDVEGAIDYLETAVELEPENAYGHNNLGKAYSMAGDNDLAKAEFLRAVELNPDISEVYFNLANVFKYEDDQEKIGDYYVKYLEKGGGDPGKVNEAVEWLRSNGRIAEVPKDFN